MKDASRILQTVLVVEDDESFRTMLVAALQRRGYDARGAESGEAALELAQQDSPEMAVVDLRLPGMSGLDVVRDLKRIDPATVVVVLTGYGSIATALEAIRLGAVHYLTKPTDADRVLEAFEHGLTALPRELAVDTPSLARVEWEHIQRVLADCGGNISEAARALSMHRRSLQRKLAKFPVPR